MGKIPKVFVGVACGNNDVPLEFERTLSEAMSGAGKLFHTERMNAIGYITDDARNDIVRIALEEDFDFVFFADIDMTFPRGCIAQMLSDCAQVPEDELPVIAGVYNSRKDYRIHAYDWREDTQDFIPINLVKDRFKLNNGLMKVDASGTGCMLIDCNVFKQLEWPWFYYEYEYSEKHQKKMRWSEDIVFCRSLMKANIKVYLDTDIICGHMQTFQIKQTGDDEYSFLEI